LIFKHLLGVWIVVSTDLVIESSVDKLCFDERNLSLQSYRSKLFPHLEFIRYSEDHPVFIIGYLDNKRRYRWLSSAEASSVKVERLNAQGRQILKAVFSDIAGQNLQVTCSVETSATESFVRWKIGIQNLGNLEIVDVQYPFIVCACDRVGTPEDKSLLLPHGYGSGKLISITGDRKQLLQADSRHAWEFNLTKGKTDHYPGVQFAQFMAYFNDQAGLYLACEDTEARIKRFQALRRESGIRLGVSHIGDWPTMGKRFLEYDTVTTTFDGDWYSAADIYRSWTSKQTWFTPLHQRTDVPDWLIDSPVHVVVRPQGHEDDGPLFPVEPFLPYDKCIPLLEEIAKKVAAPLNVILMGWERSGSWVFPECFPPIGGEEDMKDFVREIRKKGWHAGTFASGTRWVTGHAWSGYDGWDYFDRNGGEACVCRLPNGSTWLEQWPWRESFNTCVAVKQTADMAIDFVERVTDWGMESIQYLDQNDGVGTFACFAPDHGHPPVPGKWMSDKMKELVAEFRILSQRSDGNEVIHSAEAGVNEAFLSLLQNTELRTFPSGYQDGSVPLYQYLFHECIIFQDMFGRAPEPYHIAIRTALNCVLGGIPGGVLTGDGTLLDKDVIPWAPWGEKIENSDHAFEMIRTVTTLRRGPGKPFLVYGRMLRPIDVSGIQNIEWTFRGNSYAFPAVFHYAWQAPDGSKGVVFANWTDAFQEVQVARELMPPERDYVTLHSSEQTLTAHELPLGDGNIKVGLKPLSCALLLL